MIEPRKVKVGVLGQWASGKSTAVRILTDYLGGASQVVFINDRELLGDQVINYIRELDDSQLTLSLQEDGTKRLEGQRATVYLGPGEDLDSVDRNTLLFDLHKDVYGHSSAQFTWINRARVEIGNQIRARSAEGKPIIIEAGFGTNTESAGENPFSHTISDLFNILEETGLEPAQVRWIIIQASYATRSERNRQRPDTIPAYEFDRYAADGGDLDPDEGKRWQEKGAVIKRVPNDHGDIERFKTDIIAAFDELFSDRRVQS